MKIQELAIVFIIIILPISLILSEYTQFQIKTLNTQTLYDAKLTAATYDAIKAYQLNSKNETYSDIANLKSNDLEASVNAFRNSIKSAFQLTGYSEEDLNSYIPALVYTLYDGLYIYSPFINTNHKYETDEDGDIIEDPITSEPIPIEGNGESLYGFKPYISYSCRYIKGNDDVIITYALDNYITVQGKINDEYVNKSGYLIDNINIIDDQVYYNGVKIEKELLLENVAWSPNPVPYFKENGTKYYLHGDHILSISNGERVSQASVDVNATAYNYYKTNIENNSQAQEYYKDAYDFTKWFIYETDLDELLYDDAYDEVINDDTDEITLGKVWEGNTTKIFDFNSGSNYSENIENDSSSFNQHRLAVIRHKIETNLAIAISNYNAYAGAASNIFQMPELKEDEWQHITNNISLISFLQGLPIGGKIYNGYTLVTNSESEEVVLEENIYILGDDNTYHRIGDKALEENEVEVDCSGYASNSKISAGRLNLDFIRKSIVNNDSTYYFYPLKRYNASYNSIIMQNEITTYDDIYKYVNEKCNNDLKTAFYTALGRERKSKFNDENIQEISGLYIPNRYKIVEDTNFETGVVIEDYDGNQLVWVEVPRTSEVYQTAGLNITAFSSEDLEKIENDLKNYTSAYRKASCVDEYNSYEILGITEQAYNSLKTKMLKSIYKYGGFYIGRYETGILGGYRTSKNQELAKPVIQANAYPYNWVTLSQAQGLAQSFVVDDCTTSLLFGLQWDLVMKYLENNGVTQYELSTDSRSWGNFRGNSYNINKLNAKYSLDTAATWIEELPYNKAAGKSVVLTTGANKQFSKQNIYDLAGNLYEWTLEKGSSNRIVERGNYYGSSSIDYNANVRGVISASDNAAVFRGFRMTVYKNN